MIAAQQAVASDAPQQAANQQVSLISSRVSHRTRCTPRFGRCPLSSIAGHACAWMPPFAAAPFSPGLDFSRRNDTTVLQVPAARCACLLALVGRLGAFFNPKRRDQIRLYLTAGVSVADVGSDVFSISVNYRAGNTGLASALLATVLLSMSVQILIVVVVHRHHGKRRLMLEILFVVTGVKPFVDVWRILNGKANVGAPMDTMAERAGCKTVEIVVESAPTALIQMHDLLGAAKLSFATVF